MRRFVLLLLALLCAVMAGCAKRKAITDKDRKEALLLASEANFASTVRDFARAEGLLAKAVALTPDQPDYWIALGISRRMLGNVPGAKSAYESGLSACQDIDAKDARRPAVVLKQVYVLALLGRVDEARSVLAKATQDFPDNRDLKAFADSRQLDRILSDPRFQQVKI